MCDIIYISFNVFSCFCFVCVRLVAGSGCKSYVFYAMDLKLKKQKMM